MQKLKMFFSVVALFLTPISMKAYEVGDLAQGGVIFWLTPDKQHGLVAALDDITDAIWGPDEAVLMGMPNNVLYMGIECPAYVFGLPTQGQLGTELCMSVETSEGPCIPNLCAAYLSEDATGVYNDWYLPSVQELALMYRARSIIAEAAPTAAFADAIYWASLESSSTTAWGINFTSDGVKNGQLLSDQLKSNTNLRARPCRVF